MDTSTAPGSPIPDDLTAEDRWFLGSRLRVVAGAEQTNGQLTVMEQWAPLGFSPPLHLHGAEDTALHVIDGELTVVVGDETHHLGPGGFAWLPKGIAHTFRVDSQTAHLVEYATPGGVERFHLDASVPAAHPGLPAPAAPDIPGLVSAFARYSGQIVGPPLDTREVP